jgi:hypothetical protein
MAAAPSIPVAILPFATSDRIANSHRYIVESPHIPGPQAALVELIGDGGKRAGVFDAFILLPAVGPILKPIDDPFCSACLRVIKKDYRALLSRAKKDKVLPELQKKRWDEPPFTSHAHRQMRENAYGLLRSLHSGASDIEEIIGTLRERASWSPVQLQEKASLAISPEHWRVLGLWDKWEARKWDWDERFRDFAGSSYPTLRSKEKRDGRESLRKRCEWLGLAKSKSPRKRRGERTWI